MSNKELLSSTLVYTADDIKQEDVLYQNDLNELYDFLNSNKKIMFGELVPEDDCTLTFASFRRFSIPTIDEALDISNNLTLLTDKDTIKYKFVRVKNSILRNADPEDPYFMYRIAVVKRKPEEISTETINWTSEVFEARRRAIYRATKLYRMVSNVGDTILYTDMNSLYTQKELEYISNIYSSENNRMVYLYRSLEPNEFGKYRYYAYTNEDAELELFGETR